MAAYTVLLETDRPDQVKAVRRALGEASIPFQSGLMASKPPRVVFSVPSDQVSLARAAIVPHVMPDGWLGDDDLDVGGGGRGTVPRAARVRPHAPEARPDRDATRASWSSEEAMDGLDELLGSRLGLFAEAAGVGGADPGRDESGPSQSASERVRFPWRSVLAMAAVVALHVGLVAVTGGAFAAGQEWFERGLLLRGASLTEPWRFVTSLLLHSDLSHALSNGVSMIVFAVPLLESIGWRRTAAIYLLSGIGGGVTALSLARPGTAFLGSSGAVAGLFGAWAVLAFDRAREHALPWRERIRTLGIALLFLPALMSPFTPDGRPISVASHVGGLVTGMLIGAALSGLAARWQGEDPMFDTPDGDP